MPSMIIPTGYGPSTQGMASGFAGFNPYSVQLGTWPAYQSQFQPSEINVNVNRGGGWPGGLPPWDQYWSTIGNNYQAPQYPQVPGSWGGASGSGNRFPIGVGNQDAPGTFRPGEGGGLSGGIVWNNVGGGQGGQGGQGGGPADFFQLQGLPSLAELWEEAQNAMNSANEANEGRYSEMLELMRGGWGWADESGRQFLDALMGGYEDWMGRSGDQWQGRYDDVVGGLENYGEQELKDIDRMGRETLATNMEDMIERGLTSTTLPVSIRNRNFEAVADSKSRAKQRHQDIVSQYKSNLLGDKLRSLDAINERALQGYGMHGESFMDRIGNWIRGLTDVIGSRTDIAPYDINAILDSAMKMGAMGLNQMPFFNGSLPGGIGGITPGQVGNWINQLPGMPGYWWPGGGMVPNIPFPGGGGGGVGGGSEPIEPPVNRGPKIGDGGGGGGGAKPSKPPKPVDLLRAGNIDRWKYSDSGLGAPISVDPRYTDPGMIYVDPGVDPFAAGIPWDELEAAPPGDPMAMMMLEAIMNPGSVLASGYYG